MEEKLTEREKVSSEWLREFESYQNWFESLKLRSKKNEVPKSMRETYESALRNFIKFLRAGGDQEATPDSILEWARNKNDTKKGKEVIALMNKFSLWLQGNLVEGYEQRIARAGRFASATSADGVTHGGLRGFFSHNEVRLPKAGKRIRSSRTKAKQNDENYPIFKPGNNGKEIADYDLFRQFLSTLNIHDQTIIMSMLSTSQDPVDVLSLNIGFVVNQEGDRLYWEGERTKTGEGFRTFFSKEATKMVRRYTKQERKGAGEDDPLFSRTKGQRITPKNISENCNNVAQKMGLINGSTQNPYRPKRTRSIFRSACSIAGIEKGYSNIFMGHKTDVSDSYMEKPRATLELRYEMVEQYLKVFAGDVGQEIIEMKEKVTEYSERQEKAFDLMFDLREENKELREQVAKLVEDMNNLGEQLGELWSLRERFEREENEMKELHPGPDEAVIEKAPDMTPEQKEHRKRMIKMNQEK